MQTKARKVRIQIMQNEAGVGRGFSTPALRVFARNRECSQCQSTTGTFLIKISFIYTSLKNNIYNGFT